MEATGPSQDETNFTMETDSPEIPGSYTEYVTEVSGTPETLGCFATEMPPLFYQERSPEQKAEDVNRAKELLTGDFEMFHSLEQELDVEFGVTDTGAIYIPSDTQREKILEERFGCGLLWHKEIVDIGQYEAPAEYVEHTVEPERLVNVLDMLETYLEEELGISLQELTEEDIILDMGCGAGTLDEMLAKRDVDATVIGIDAQTEMVKHARMEAAANNRSNTHYIEGDAPTIMENNGTDEVTIPDNSVKIAVASFSPQWFNDQEQGFKQLERKLTDDGVAIYVFAAEGNQNEYSICRDKVLAEMNTERISRGEKIVPYMPRVLDMFDTDYLYKGIKKSGLEIVNEGAEVDIDFNAVDFYKEGKNMTKFLEMVAGDKNLFHGMETSQIIEAKEKIKDEYNQMTHNGIGPTNRVAYVVIRKRKTIQNQKATS
jgi:ubiquinone/menaquinone biosynthesis C-methylase UbiE